jgi:hypothetical protein
MIAARRMGAGHYVVATAIPHFVGKFPLHNVFVAPFCPMGWLPNVDYGTIFPSEMERPRQGIYLQFPPDLPERDLHCALSINTSNGSYFQWVRFVKQGAKWTWASRFSKYGSKQIKRQFSGPDFPKEQLKTK